MASRPAQLPVAGASADRRMVARSELSLGVTLHQVGEAAVIPAAIANLSATGFLAELPEGAQVPAFLDVDLPNAGRRKAEVVWQSGSMTGCNFTVPLSRADISAARLKSTFTEQEQLGGASADQASAVSAADHAVADSASMFEIGPSDPIWDMINEARPEERWPLPARAGLIAAVAILPWAAAVGLALSLT